MRKSYYAVVDLRGKGLIMPKIPNRPVRQIREAASKSQSEFADELGVSVAYVQAIEQGSRAPSRDFAAKIMGRFGAWWFCILENWEKAVDLYGKPYTSLVYEDFCRDVPETISEEQMAILLDPLRKLFLGAAEVGKVRLVAFWLRHALLDGARYMRNVSFAGATIREVQITFGELRVDKARAQALGFHDDPTRRDIDVAMVIHCQGEAIFSLEYPDDRDVPYEAGRPYPKV